MVATTAFSVVLLIAATTTIQIGKLYYKGLIQSKTQDTARAVSDDISRSIEFARGDRIDGINNATQSQLCVGDTRYTWRINEQVQPGGTTIGLKQKRIDTSDPCGETVAANLGTELLGTNMRLLYFNVVHLDPAKKTYQINIRIAYGANDLLTHYDNNGVILTGPAGNPDNALCKTGISGSSFCAVSRLDNVVRKRLN